MPVGWTISARRAAAGLATVAGLAVGGCAGGPSDVIAPAAQRATTPAAPGPGGGSASPSAPASSTPLAPLTGLPATSARAAGRPAVALPLSGGQLQGLSSADVVFEEMTSPLRYIAVFQSRDDSSVGPVGQTRPTDGQVLSVLHPLTVYDGGTPSFVKVLDQTQVVDVSSVRYPSLYHPGAEGPTVSTSEVRQSARDSAPPQLFSYQGSAVGEEAGFASAGAWRTSSLRIAAPGQATETWVFGARSHLWRLVSGGPAVRVANIVVQKVPYKTVFLSHKYGLTTTSARIIGSGGAIVLSAMGPADRRVGAAVKGTWSKPGIHEVTNYLDASGRPVGFQPGTTWVILVPPGSQISTSRSGS